jgi:hypothetical protein
MPPLPLLLLALQAGVPAACADAPRTAEPFAPVLRDSARLFRGTFSADGRTLYYFRKLALDREDYRIYVSRLQNERWTPGERLSLGGEFSDLYPSVSPDGSRLVFASYRPAPGDTSAEPNAYLWYADREGSGWGPPRFIAPAARFGEYHSGPLIDSSKSITFSRTSADWRTSGRMATSWTGSGYAPASPLADDPAARWKTWRANELYVWGGLGSPRGNFVLLDVSRLDARGRRGPADVWVTLLRNGEWSEPVPAGGEVNRAGYENFLVFHPDGCSIVFVRDFSSFHRISIEALIAPASRLPHPVRGRIP